MSIWATLFSGGTKGVLEGVGELVRDVRGAITGSTPLSAEQRTQLLTQLDAAEAAADAAAAAFDTEQMKGQLDINKIEASSDSKFKSWARPAFLWVGVTAFAVQFVIAPLVPWCVKVVGLIFGHPNAVNLIPAIPTLDVGVLGDLTFGLLGVAGMRSYDKRQRLQAGTQ